MATMDYLQIYNEFLRILDEKNIRIESTLELIMMGKNGQPSSDKIERVVKLMEEFNLFPDVVSLEEEKNDEKAVEFREEGNAFFKYFKYFKALTLYNKSICYAESMENLSVAMANRSACFFKMEMFPECLESIRLAREVGLPQRLTEKMADREAKCKEEIEKKTLKEGVFVPKINMPVNEKIPFLAKCLELRQNKTFGRHIVTKRNIPVGTIIAIEEPHYKVLPTTDKYLRCVTCMAEVPHRLFPCGGCTQTMFCSKECQEKALADFHAIECPISGTLFKIFDDGCRLVFRMIILAFSTFPDTKTMAKAVKRIGREKKTVFSFDWTKPLTPEEFYTPIHNLITNEDQYYETFLIYVISSLVFNILHQSCPIFSQRYLTTKEAEDFLKNMIFKHHLICHMNFRNLDSATFFVDPEINKCNYGGAIYGFHSLLNHSCAPNTMTVAMGGASGLVTIMNIAAGEQIFTNYDINYTSKNRTARLEKLKKSYYFDCKCIACVKDYPLLRNTPQPKGVPEMPLHTCLLSATLSQDAIESTKKDYQMTCDFIRKYEHLYPIPQLSNAELQLYKCLNIMCGNIPLRIREEIRVIEAEEKAQCAKQ